MSPVSVLLNLLWIVFGGLCANYFDTKQEPVARLTFGLTSSKVSMIGRNVAPH